MDTGCCTEYFRHKYECSWKVFLPLATRHVPEKVFRNLCTMHVHMCYSGAYICAKMLKCGWCFVLIHDRKISVHPMGPGFPTTATYMRIYGLCIMDASGCTLPVALCCRADHATHMVTCSYFQRTAGRASMRTYMVPCGSLRPSMRALLIVPISMRTYSLWLFMVCLQCRFLPCSTAVIKKSKRKCMNPYVVLRDHTRP